MNDDDPTIRLVPTDDRAAEEAVAHGFTVTAVGVRTEAHRFVLHTTPPMETVGLMAGDVSLEELSDRAIAIVRNAAALRTVTNIIRQVAREMELTDYETSIRRVQHLDLGDGSYDEWVIRLRMDKTFGRDGT